MFLRLQYFSGSHNEYVYGFSLRNTISTGVKVIDKATTTFDWGIIYLYGAVARKVGGETLS